MVHRHMVCGHTFFRVSELIYMHGEPCVILCWINSAGVSTPLTVALESEKLRRAAGKRLLYFYSGVTVDPR